MTAMYISDSDYAKMLSILQEIRCEGRKEKQRRNRIPNLADKVSVILRRASKRKTN